MIETPHELISARVISILARSMPFDRPETGLRIARLYGTSMSYAYQRVANAAWPAFYDLVVAAGATPRQMVALARLRSMERSARLAGHYDRLPPELQPPSRITESTITGVLERAGLEYVLSKFPAHLNQ